MSDDLSTLWVLERAALANDNRLPSFVARLVEAAASDGEFPNRLRIDGVHKGSKYRAFVKKRLPEYLHAMTVTKRASILHVAQLDVLWESGWSWYVAFNRDIDQFNRNARVFDQNSGRIDLGVAHSSALYPVWSERPFVEELAQEFGGVYGYRFVQKMCRVPKSYAECSGYGDCHRDLPLQENQLLGAWAGRGAEARACGVLRDVFPSSWLSPVALERPIGRSGPSLRDWILKSPSRGVLKDAPSGLTAWHVPPVSIPFMREELYRGGRILDWRFAQEKAIWIGKGHSLSPHPPNPYYRPDLSEPWEAPDPIPEIFRADFYRDKDPGLTL